jgi:hypothetical protein
MTSQNTELSYWDTLYRFETERKIFVGCSRWVMVCPGIGLLRWGQGTRESSLRGIFDKSDEIE